MFLIKDNKLYWSESYIPLGFIGTSNVTVCRDEEDLVALVPWSDQLYIASRYEWYRLQGSSAETWTIKRTFTDAGIVNRHTVQRTRFGILGLYYDGIYLFDGATNKNLTEKYLGSSFFSDIADLDLCYGFFDGVKYYFYYPSSGSTSIDSCIVIDCTYYPDFRVYQDDSIATARDYHQESGTHYIGKSGYECSISGTETISTELQTGDFVFGDITKRKNLKYLYYDVNTNSQNMTVTIYCDGSSACTITLNNSARTRKRYGPLPQIEGYRFSVNIACSASSGIEIYAPWALEADFVGD